MLPCTAQWCCELNNFTRIKKKRLNTEYFDLCGHKWHLSIFPHGNRVADHLSLYLLCDSEKAHGLGYYQDVRFTLEVNDPVFPTKSIKREAYHRFSEKANGWGFTQFMKLGQLYDTLRDDKLHICVVIELMEYDNYSRGQKETPDRYVGLKGQRATCYMNSLLQSLYHIPYFRKAVYQLAANNEVSSNNFQLAVQRIFYCLQFGNTSVGAEELALRIGWIGANHFIQRDGQELARELLYNLQTVDELFQGKIRNFIKCVDVDFESNREETYFGLTLNVKGCTEVMHSFEKYIEVEMLQGSNKYHAEGFGLQTARKGCKFLSFPSILHLQLKRLENESGTVVKFNNKYIFTECLDLSKFMTDDADKSNPPIFHLYAVIVQRRDEHGVRYYAFIKPTTKPDWFKFDDEVVTKATTQQVTEDNFGGESNNTSSNAYMLVYLRACDLDNLLCTITNIDIPVHLKDKFEKEVQQSHKREWVEAHLYISLKIATDKDLRHGRRTDLVMFEFVKEIKVKKASTISITRVLS